MWLGVNLDRSQPWPRMLLLLNSLLPPPVAASALLPCCLSRLQRQQSAPQPLPPTVHQPCHLPCHALSQPNPTNPCSSLSYSPSSPTLVSLRHPNKPRSNPSPEPILSVSAEPLPLFSLCLFLPALSVFHFSVQAGPELPFLLYFISPNLPWDPLAEFDYPVVPLTFPFWPSFTQAPFNRPFPLCQVDQSNSVFLDSMASNNGDEYVTRSELKEMFAGFYRPYLNLWMKCARWERQRQEKNRR